MTIQRAIKAGKLSANRDRPNGPYQIDPAELHRVFPPKPGDKIGAPAQPASTRHDAPLQETRLLEREIAIRDDQLEQLKAERRRERDQLQDTIDDLRRRLDGEAAERQRLTLLLTDQRDATEGDPNAQGRHPHLWAWPWRRTPA